MSNTGKGIVIGIIIGLLVGVGLSYVSMPKTDMSLIEQRLRYLEEQVNKLMNQTQSLENMTSQLALTLGTSNSPPTRAYNAFLNIEGILGGATDEKHSGQIEVIYFAHKVTLSRDPATGNLSPSMRLSVIKNIDRSSPKLYMACCNRQLFSEVTLEVTYPNGDVMKYVLEYVLLSDVMPMEDISLNTPLPMEGVSFNYRKIRWEYTPLNEPSISGSYDLEENIGIYS